MIEFSKHHPSEIEDSANNCQLDKEWEESEKDPEHSKHEVENCRGNDDHENDDNECTDCLSHNYLRLLLKMNRSDDFSRVCNGGTTKVVTTIPDLHRAIRDSHDGGSIKLSPRLFSPFEKIDRFREVSVNGDQFPSLCAQLIEIALKRDELTGE